MSDQNPPVIFDQGAPERNKIADGQVMPSVSDTSLNVTGAPDADYHPVAMANAVVDSEAGAIPDHDMGGIVPLKRRE